MAIEIRKVTDKKMLKRFIRFNYEFYKDNPYSVPDLYDDMLGTLSSKRNAAFDFCEADYFLALRDGQTVGRVAAIINHRANEKWGKRIVRFGWIDFIDDIEVSRALISVVKAWGKERGMDTIEGPLGFTDMDAEGMLVEGFDQLSTMATISNYPYYPQHMEQLGLEKSADWVEMKIYVPDSIPEKHKRISDIIARKYNLHIRKLTSKREVMRSGIGHQIFRLINDAYAPLFNFSRMTERQIDQYVKMYVPVLDLLLVGVRPDYQNKGVNALLFTDLIPVYQQLGFEYAESNPELEQNDKVQNQWQYFKTEQHKRRRCYKQSI